MRNLARYSKLIAAAIGSGLTWAGVAWVPDGHISRPEWYALAVALATAAGVYGVTNAPAPPAP
jgi:hypothetical protein